MGSTMLGVMQCAVRRIHCLDVKLGAQQLKIKSQI